MLAFPRMKYCDGSQNVHRILGKPTCQLAVLIAEGPLKVSCADSLRKGRTALNEV